MRTVVGTSGYSYKEWKGEGKFYPPKMKAQDMLGFYAARFPSVEINSTFYQFPEKEALEAQATQVPASFTFAFKAPGEITHRKRLKAVEKPVADLFDTLSVLGPQLGPVLFGLPPNFKKDAAKLSALLAACPKDQRVAVEFRHASWFDEETYAILRAADAALCIAVAEDLETPLVATASWGYLRLRHEAYSEGQLTDWAAKIAAQSWSDAVVYFKHEDTGSAPRFAEQLTALLPKL